MNQKRYAVLDRNGTITVETDDRDEAFAAICTGSGVSLLDRSVKRRVSVFAGKFSEFPPKPKPVTESPAVPKLVSIKPIPPGYVPIAPVIGCIVNYYTSQYDGVSHENGQPLAAIIVRVWGPSFVNLTVFDHNGGTHARTSVVLAQPGDEVNEANGYCCWSMYQVERAASEGK